MEKTAVKKKYNKLYKLLAVTAVNAVISAAAYILFYRLFGTLAFIPGLLLAVMCAVGYGMQAIYGRLTSRRRDPRRGYDDEFGYEGHERAFAPLRAAGPLTIAALLSVFSYGLYNSFLISYSGLGNDFFYSEYSIYPLIFCAATFIGLASGIILWFYPAHRVISLRTMLTFLVVLLIIFFGAVMFGVPSSLITAYLFIFTLCAFTVMNQTHIQRGLSDTLTAISPSGRVYNLLLIAVTVVCALLFVFLASVILTGLKYIVLLIGSVIFSGAERQSAGEFSDYTVEDVNREYGRFFISNQPFGEKILFALFIILFVAALVLFLTRGAEMTQRILKKVREWIVELFMFFTDIGGFKSSRYGTEIDFSNYRDEEIKLEHAVIREYNGGEGSRRSYREFISKLNSLPSASEQIRFAYAALMASYRERGFGNRLSNTPREAKEKISARTSAPALDDAVRAIETVDYAERELPDDECHRVISSICGIIETQWQD